MTSSTRRHIEIPEGKPVSQRMALEHETPSAAAEEAERRAAIVILRRMRLKKRAHPCARFFDLRFAGDGRRGR
jgi:hypothetical protein